MARLGKTGRPPAIIAIKSICRECNHWNRADCEIVWCPAYYWQPGRTLETDLSWVEANAYRSADAFAEWMKKRGG